jgi:LysR family transcriptional regulator of gallate degradation
MTGSNQRPAGLRRVAERSHHENLSNAYVTTISVRRRGDVESQGHGASENPVSMASALLIVAQALAAASYKKLLSMKINFRHLVVAREVANRGTISGTAEAVALSQPAVTQAIAALERIVAAPLFERSNRGIAPTPSGTQFFVRVDRALGHLSDALAETMRATGRDSFTQALRRLERSITSAQLHALVWVVEHGGFSEAARAAGVSAPTVHRAARDLERMIGFALFERTSFGVRPTREAVRLARGAKLAFAEIAQGCAELRSAGGGDSGSTVIGSLPLALCFLLPRALIEFANSNPEHTVAILDGRYDNLIAELRGGTADFLIGALRDPFPYKDMIQEPLFDDELAIIMRAGHPLAGRTLVNVHALSAYPWIAPRRESPLHAQFDELFRSTGIAAPATTIECNSIVAARGLLFGSDHLMLLSRHQMQYDLRAGLLAALPHPLGHVTRPIGLTFRTGWQPTSTQQRLLDVLRTQAVQDALAS